MLEAFKKTLGNQFDAAFCTLGVCVDRCPDEVWRAPVAKLKFCQVAFHTLFFADLYLGKDLESFRQQGFHSDNEAIFADYEELDDRAPQHVYEKQFIRAYLQHCRDKAKSVLAAETAEALSETSRLSRKAISRAELYLTNFRHIVHHTAQLTLRLRLDTAEDIPWIHSGWEDA